MREVASDQDEHWFETYGRVARDRRPERFEAASTPLGRWWTVYAFPVGEPEARRVAVLFNDITARKGAEAERERLLGELKVLNETLEQQVSERTKELERSQIRFQQAFHAGPVATCITTLDQDACKETFVEVNEAFAQLTGYPAEEVIGRTADDLGMWSSREDQRALEGAQRDDPSFRNLELQVRTKE